MHRAMGLRFTSSLTGNVHFFNVGIVGGESHLNMIGLFRCVKLPRVDSDLKFGKWGERREGARLWAADCVSNINPNTLPCRAHLSYKVL